MLTLFTAAALPISGLADQLRLCWHAYLEARLVYGRMREVNTLSLEQLVREGLITLVDISVRQLRLCMQRLFHPHVNLFHFSLPHVVQSLHRIHPTLTATPRMKLVIEFNSH